MIFHREVTNIPDKIDSKGNLISFHTIIRIIVQIKKGLENITNIFSVPITRENLMYHYIESHCFSN